MTEDKVEELYNLLYQASKTISIAMSMLAEVRSPCHMCGTQSLECGGCKRWRAWQKEREPSKQTGAKGTGEKESVR
ncbi:hypothetical protein AGMMS49992_11900 [Clostridia bacterium]|nr:hypothetical protein AGMMS49992_11900 [Clostridia bacterium]